MTVIYRCSAARKSKVERRRRQAPPATHPRRMRILAGRKARRRNVASRMTTGSRRTCRDHGESESQALACIYILLPPLQIISYFIELNHLKFNQIYIIK
jgi:hypothetical protein